MKPIQINVALADLDSKWALAISPSDDPRCSVEREEIVKIEPGKVGEKFPVFLVFEADRPITAIGFATSQNDLKTYSQKGPCGGDGCFSLEDAIDSKSTKTPWIRNAGRDANSATQFYFMLDFADGKKLFGIDPQIYNQGVGDPTSWWHRLVRLFRRLWAWLRG